MGQDNSSATKQHQHFSLWLFLSHRIFPMSVSNRRLKVMEALDQRMEELEEFEQYGEEYQNLLEETDLLEDENYLYELERHRRHLEKESLVGTVWEPSLIFCWLILSFVLFYVGFIIVAGDIDRHFIKEELLKNY